MLCAAYPSSWCQETLYQPPTPAPRFSPGAWVSSVPWMFSEFSCYASSTENAGQLYLPVFQMFLGPDSGLFDVLPLDATSTYRYGLGLHEEYSSTLVWQTSVSFVRMCFLLKIINMWRGCVFLFPMIRYSRKVANSPKMRRRAKIRRTGLVHWLAEKKMKEMKFVKAVLHGSSNRWFSAWCLDSRGKNKCM